jgi:geranylgeranyl diphosphate synthase, type II
MRRPAVAPQRRAPRASAATPATADARASATRLAAFERHLAAALPRAATVPATVHEAMRYAALGPGKRLRPLLCLAACEAVGGDWRDALSAAAALECVHAFSLVHDDLPSMDDDDYRRGRLTTHKKYGEAIGLLAGDALLSFAFEELARLAERGVPAARVLDAVRVLAVASGSRELVGGQVLDLEGEQKKRVDATAVRAIHARKTGALMGAALALGAIAGGASRATVKRLDTLGRDLGVAFQIHDDLLNRESSLATLGKRAGTDDARGKATWPRAVGEARARLDAGRIFARALTRVHAMGPRARTLGALIVAVAERTR